MDLNNWKEVANTDEKEEISKTQEIKEKERFEYPIKEAEAGNRTE